MNLTLFVVSVLFGLVNQCALFCQAGPPGSIQMNIINHAGKSVNVFWINTFSPSRNGELNLVKQTTKSLRNCSDSQINSYNGHEFLVRFEDHIPGVEVRFAKGPYAETVTIVTDEDNQLKAVQVSKLDEMRNKIASTMDLCEENKEEDLKSCISKALFEDYEKLDSKHETMQSYRDLISNRLRNYTCADDDMATSSVVSSYKMKLKKANKDYRIDILLDSSHAKIWTIENFITDKECDVLLEHGKTRLTRATVAAEDGSSVVSESRRAQQASYDLHFKHPNTDPLAPLFSRVYEVANTHTGYQLTEGGQEGFTIIQYNVSDEYIPHCDGACEGKPHKAGGRIATSVLYCQAASRGGGTSFTNSDIFVKGKRGQAVFFAYKGSDGLMDEGYTRHSGCPVYEGGKQIAVVWMREGVSKSDPWSNFDPQGNRILAPQRSSWIDMEHDGDSESEEYNHPNDEMMSMTVNESEHEHRVAESSNDGVATEDNRSAATTVGQKQEQRVDSPHYHIEVNSDGEFVRNLYKYFTETKK